MELQDVVLPDALPEGPRPGTVAAYHVYFIYCAGRIKIGRAMNVKERHSQIATGSPFEPKVLHFRPAPMGTEEELHRRFAADRVHREWFRLSDALRRYLMRELTPEGRETLLKAEQAFVAELAPLSEPAEVVKWKRPRKTCAHKRPLSRRCSKCARETALRVYDELVKRIERG